MKKIHLILGVLAALSCGAVWYQHHITTPEYLAKKALERSELAIQEKDYEQAISELRFALASSSQYANTARTRIRDLLSESHLQSISPEHQLTIFFGFEPLKRSVPNYSSVLQAMIDNHKGSNDFIAGALSTLAIHDIEDEKQKANALDEMHNMLVSQSDQFAAHPQVAKAFALLDEQIDQCQHCELALSAHIDTLEDHEAARALGQFFASQGRVEESFRLLEPYTEKRLAVYRDAEAAYEAATEEVWQRTIDFLNAGGAQESFYTAYDAADELEQNNLVNEIYSKRLDASRSAQKALSNYQGAAEIVPVALDLAIVRLGRALNMTDASSREHELQRAEQTFLSVKSYAGDSDDYQMYLGQVYYWLGKEDKGREQFDALINKYERDHQVIAAVAGMLRDLGANNESKLLIEEAYNNAPAGEAKKNYAYQRSLLASDVEETINWIERSNTELPYVQAALHSSRGKLAEQENELDSAAVHYQKSIDAYKALPQEGSTLNNVALVYLAKYRITREEKDYDGALANMDKAIEMMPDDSIVLSNAADLYAAKVYREFIAPSINLDLIHYQPSMGMLAYLYHDEAEQQLLVNKIIAHEAFPRLKEYTQKASLLAPKSVVAAQEVSSLYQFFDLADESLALKQRIESIGVDLSDSYQSVSRYRSGAEDSDDLEAIASWVYTLVERRNVLNKDKQKIEYAILTNDLIGAKLQKFEYVDPTDELVRLLDQAKNNYAFAPSSATASQLVRVYGYLGVNELASISPEFNALFDSQRRVLGNVQLLNLGFHSIDGLSAQAKNSKYVTAYLRALKDSVTRFPSSLNASNILLLGELDRQLQEKLFAEFSRDEQNKLKMEISHLMSPNKEGTFVEKLAYASLQKDQPQLSSLLENIEQQGLALPTNWIFTAVP